MVIAIHNIKATLYSFILASFKGVSQVLLIENAISGFIITAAIMAANFSLGIITLLSAMIGTWIGFALVKDKAPVKQGLFGYNSVLTAIALTLFLDGVESWGIALAGAALAALVTAACMYMMRNSTLPILTLPFVVLTWLLLLASSSLEVFKQPSKIEDIGAANFSQLFEEPLQLWEGFLNGIGQVYLQDNMWTGLFILVAIFWASRRMGLYTVIGTIVAWLTAYGFGADVTMLNLGLYGYNAVLTILAVSAVFHTKDSKLLTGIIAAIITIPMTAALGVLFMPYGISPLTMPFILVTWIFIAARNIMPKI